MITLKELNEAYDKLGNFKGAKQRAHDVYGADNDNYDKEGMSGHHFRYLLKPEGKATPDQLAMMYLAIKQAASEHLRKVKQITVEIESQI